MVTNNSNNLTTDLISTQLAQRSGQVSISKYNGGVQFIDDLTGAQLVVNAASTLLANPQNPADPRIKAVALDLARGYYATSTTSNEMIEAIATVAAYVSATEGIPIGSLLTNHSVSLKLINAYNSFKSKGSQVGILSASLLPNWTNNPTLRGSINLAIQGVNNG